MKLRDIQAKDTHDLWKLNQTNAPHVSSLTEEGFSALCELAEFARVLTDGDNVLGFLIGFLPHSTYPSVNYQWFEQHHPLHCYIDRINVAESARGQGVASKLYADFAQFAQENNIRMLSCEVNIRPQNEVSLAFHNALNFVEVGRQEIKNGQQEVVMLLKNL